MRLIAGSLAFLVSAVPVVGQCIGFSSEFGSSLNGRVSAVVPWATAPGGPQRMLVGGLFTANAACPCDYVGYWDGAWRPMGWGTDGQVDSVILWDPDGAGPLSEQPIAGGGFLHAGSGATGEISTNGIARWDGTSWRALGSGVDGSVKAMISWDPDGPGPGASLLIAGGSFTHAGGLLTGGIARWDGTQWRGLGWGLNGPVFALTTWDPDGAGPLSSQLVAAGGFTMAGADNTGQVGPCSVARWDGTVWTPMGTPAQIRSLVVFDADGPGPHAAVLLAGGEAGVQEWNGASWSWFGDGFAGLAHVYTGYSDMEFWAPVSVAALGVWDLDGDGPGLPQLFATGAYHWDNPPYTKGDVFHPGGQSVRNIAARFDGFGFSVVGEDAVLSMAVREADGSGPGASRLVLGGLWAPYIQSLSGASTLMVTPPSGVSVRIGGSAALTVLTSGGVSPTFRWQCSVTNNPPWIDLTDGERFNGVVTGSAAATLRLAHVSSEASSFAYRCLVYDQGCLISTTDGVYINIRACGTADFNGDGDAGTDFDIQAFFSCLGGDCCATCYAGGADFNADGDTGTDADIESFFRVLGGGPC